MVSVHVLYSDSRSFICFVLLQCYVYVLIVTVIREIFSFVTVVCEHFL